MNKVRRPVAAVLVLKQGCIRRHLHHVAVALHTHDECGLADGSQQVAGSHAAVAGILTYIYVMRARYVIKEVVVVEEEIGVAIPMGIDHIVARNLRQQRVGVA